ncbi:YidH family protein [Streptomyces werraensis]|uniref:YidH family protein n=1 Tax=Streptomyces werraensis TaxID=68284 RepID=UPI001CE37209
MHTGPVETEHRPARRWYEEGEEPDYRFSLANERTFLAWLRTGLALLAASVAIAQFVQAPAPRALGRLLALLLAMIGTALCAMAYRRWRRVQHAMRHRRPLPRTRLPATLTWAISLLGAAAALLIVTTR